MAFRHAISGENGPSAVQALERLADGAQGVVRDQLELARIDARDTVLGSLSGVSAAVVGAMFLFVGWLALSGAAYNLLLFRLLPWASFAVVAAANITLGAAVAAWGITRIRNPRGA